MFNKVLLSTAIVAFVQADQQQDNTTKCNALILSGGGALGAWEAGVYYGFTHSSQASDFHYDVISGVSAGAINTAAVCQFKKGDDAKCAQFLSEQWPLLSDNQIYTQWSGGIVDGLLNEQGVFNDSVLGDTIERILDAGNLNEWKRPATFAAVDVATGDYVKFDQSNISSRDEIIQAAKSSASIPGVFPPNHFKGKYLMDGGTVYNANIVSGIQMCKDLGFSESNIVVDVYNCGSVEIATSSKAGHTRHNWERDHYLRSSYGFQTYLYDTMQQYPKVDYRYVVGVDFDYSELSLLDFSPTNTNKFQTNGRRAAAEALSEGPGVNAKRIYKKVAEERILMGQ